MQHLIAVNLGNAIGMQKFGQSSWKNPTQSDLIISILKYFLSVNKERAIDYPFVAEKNIWKYVSSTLASVGTGGSKHFWQHFATILP